MNPTYIVIYLNLPSFFRHQNQYLDQYYPLYNIFDVINHINTITYNIHRLGCQRPAEGFLWPVSYACLSSAHLGDALFRTRRQCAIPTWVVEG